MNAIYTTEAVSTGAGRNGSARTDDGRLELRLAAPKALGGSGDGTNPEQLFAAGYAACFHSALQLVARQAKADIGESSVGARVSIINDGQGGFGLEVGLEVVIPTLSHHEATALAEKADKVCPYSNATRGNLDVTITVTDD
ncbi:organic hydroperoxide resistance protein [Arthrobacter sp. efr-133-TYG-120]|uniref:organic hydroperoxide resistance protein n=1 Tax=Arthrobacter sp. efr-133-TYG-120 TaxID=3040280 RepID=UPI00254AA9AE|nr:organic hydroperoxide resistance protein [Arthrobacter sp. efr-133-TYG-120]